MRWPTEQGIPALKKCVWNSQFDGLQFSDVHVSVLSDREYPHLGQMIVDYENPLKKMMEEFVPHSKVRAGI